MTAVNRSVPQALLRTVTRPAVGLASSRATTTKLVYISAHAAGPARHARQAFSTTPALARSSGSSSAASGGPSHGSRPRTMATTGQARRDSEPRYASTRDDIREDYPPAGLRRDISGQSLPQHGMHEGGARTPQTFSMANKVCVVTGGAKGTGRLLAETLVDAGSKLAIVDKDYESAKQAAAEISATLAHDKEIAQTDVHINAYQCDVTSEEEVVETFEAINNDFGRIDVLTVAAGIMHTRPVRTSSYSPRRMRSPFAINVDGAFFTAREAAHFMERSGKGGSIVIMGSMSGADMGSAAPLDGNQPQAPYEAALAASRQMSRSLALEWAPKGIRVNCITPGPMSTALTRQIAEKRPKLKKLWESLTPAGRLGEPSDLQGPLLYLASDASSYVTATTLKVDGGWSNS